MQKKILTLMNVIIMLFLLSNPATKAGTETSITVDKVIARDESSISVPIRISDNAGVCGAVLSINYDSRLTLTDIEKGSAFSSLTMTKPGNLSDNPVKLVWDGLEADTTNGIVAELIFAVPKSAGVYDISIAYGDGDIVDGKLNPMTVHMEGGSVTRQGEAAKSTPTISVAEVTTKQGSQIKVPISISGNTGLRGAAISVKYDDRLVLSDISPGSALSLLNISIPGRLSQNPFTLLWDGVESDNSNGVIVVLTFNAPQGVGTYDISVSYTEGDIVDGNLSPVEMEIKQGQIKVVSPKNIVVEVNGEQITMIGENESNNEIIAAFYDNNQRIISVKHYNDTDNIVKINNTVDASYVKIMLWESLSSLRPLDKAQTIPLN